MVDIFYSFYYNEIKNENQVPSYKIGTIIKESVNMMFRDCVGTANFEDTGFSYTLSLISGKYKMVILYCLMEYKIVRFNEMQRYLGKISDKTLSMNLKELEHDALIVRKVYPQIPPKVEYSLSERGKSLVKVMDELCRWGNENRD